MLYLKIAGLTHTTDRAVYILKLCFEIMMRFLPENLPKLWLAVELRLMRCAMHKLLHD